MPTCNLPRRGGGSSLALTLLGLCLTASAAFAQPAIESCAPAALRAGHTTHLTLSGKDLAGITALWTSAGSAEVAQEPAQNGENPAQVALQVTLPAMPPGVVGLRVATAKGVSNLALLLVDDLPLLVDEGKNKTADAAQPIALPALLSGRMPVKGERRYYRFSLPEKRRLSVDVFAQRLGEAFDPVATLLDGQGREVAACDDDPATRPDARLLIAALEPGDYTLEIHDIRYREGRYVARLGDLPLANPPPAAPTPGRFPVVAESEPNDNPAAAAPAPVPATLAGAIAMPGDRDHFRLPLKKGERIVVANQSRSLFSPGEFLIHLVKADGARLAEIDDRETGGEGRLEFAAPADGDYLLSIEDSAGRGSADHVYRLDLRPTVEAVRLRAKVDRFVARPGGTISIPLERDRPGYEGPVEVSLLDPISGVELAHRIHAKKTGEERLLITLPGDWKAGDLRTFRLVAKGVGSSGPGELVSTESSALSSPRRFRLASHLDGHFAVSIAGESLPLFALKSMATEVLFDRTTGQAKFVLSIERIHKDYKELPVILAEGLPPGATIEGKKKGDTEIDVVLIAPKDLPAGKHPLKILGYGEFQGRGQRSLVEGVTVIVP